MKVKTVSAESQYEKRKDLKREDVLHLQNWARQQPHFPPLEDVMVMAFYHSCYGGIQATKTTLENFLLCKTNTPEFFKDMDPRSEEMMRVAESVCIGVLPKLTNEGYGIIYVKLMDFTIFPFDTYVKTLMNSVKLHMRESGLLDGYVLVIDCEGASVFHLFKLPLASAKKCIEILQECMPIRLKAIHFVKPSYIIDRLFALLTPLTRSEVVKLVCMHRYTSVFDYVPKHCLPNESGGTLGSVREVQDYFQKRMLANVEQILHDETIVVDIGKIPARMEEVSGRWIFVRVQ